jgi:hypothetical protein
MAKPAKTKEANIFRNQSGVIKKPGEANGFSSGSSFFCSKCGKSHPPGQCALNKPFWQK